MDQSSQELPITKKRKRRKCGLGRYASARKTKHLGADSITSTFPSRLESSSASNQEQTQSTNTSNTKSNDKHHLKQLCNQLNYAKRKMVSKAEKVQQLQHENNELEGFNLDSLH